MKLTKILLLIALTASLSGCVSDHYRGQNGVSFDRVAIGNKTGIASASFNPTTGEFKVKGYSNDQTDALAAVTTAFVDALLKALAAPKP